MLFHSQEGASSEADRFRFRSVSHSFRPAASICLAWARPTTCARKPAIPTASSREKALNLQLEVLRQQFPDKNRFAEEVSGHHAAAEKR
jgi:hypothetical protein